MIVREADVPISSARSYLDELTQDLLRYVPGKYHDRIMTAYMELRANAIQATQKYNGERIKLTWFLDGILLRLDMTNFNVEFEPTWQHYLMPGIDKISGRGIPLVYLHTDDLYYETKKNQTTVTAYWHLYGDAKQEAA